MTKQKNLYRLEGVVHGISGKEIHPSLRFTRAYSKAQAFRQFYSKFRKAFPRHHVRLIGCEVLEIEEEPEHAPSKKQDETPEHIQPKLFSVKDETDTE